MQKEVLFALIEKWEHVHSDSLIAVDESPEGRIRTAIDQENQRTKRQCANDLRALILLLDK